MKIRKFIGIAASICAAFGVVPVALAETVGYENALATQAGAESSENDGGTQRLTLTDGRGKLTQSAQENDLSENSSYLYLSKAIEVSEFGVLGVTWNVGQSLPKGALVEVRTLAQGKWSAWYVLGEEDSEGGRPGTEMSIWGASTGIQIRISGQGNLPAGLTINMIDGEGTSREITPQEVSADMEPQEGTQSDSSVNAEEASSILDDLATGVESTDAFSSSDSSKLSQASASEALNTQDGPQTLPTLNTLSGAGAKGTKGVMIRTALSADRSARAKELANIHPRAAWEADESMMKWPPSYSALHGAIVHHTAGTNDYTRAQVPSIIRGIYSYHAKTREWGDIGYNVLVDKYGGRWEGRKGTLSAAPGQMVIGAHAAPRNTGTLGVSVMGNYTGSVMPTREVLSSVSDVIASAFAIGRVDPSTRSPLTVPTGRNGMLPAGSTLPRIAGHKDIAATACPGNIYGYLDEIRDAVRLKYAQLHSQDSSPVKPSASPEESGGSRYFLSNTWADQDAVSFKYGTSEDQEIVGDWDGDGKDTVSVRRGRDFAINNSTVPAGNMPVYNLSYGRPGDEYFVGDWDGDGVDTLAVRRGNTFYVKNSVTSGNADQVFTYGRAGETILVGDWNGDGKDTFVVRRGKTYLVRNSLTSGVAEASFDYGRAGDEVLVGHFSGRRADSLTVRRGNTYYISNVIKNGAADRVITFGHVSDKALVGDWDGDFVDTFGVRRG